VKFCKLALLVGATLALVLPTGGCSSKVEDKEPKLTGPGNPNLKPIGRGAGGAGKPSGPSGQAPLNKN
jgi:hypothetical protein